MKIVSLEELTEKMVLARPLYRDTDMALLNEGVENLARYRKNFKKFGFQYFCVKDDPLAAEEMEASVAEAMRIEGQRLARQAMEDLLTAEETLNQAEWQSWLEEVVYQLFCGKTALKNMMDLKKHDINLYMHSINVAVLAVKIGKALRYTVKQQLALGNGAMLHDIGMLLISDALRQKPLEAMDDTERKIYQTHSQIGSEMLHEIDDVDEASRLVVMRHHEQINGQGYPYGVSGDKLDEMTRIVSVCDVYDDLIRKGNVGAPVSPKEAVEHLVAGSADKYDKKIVAYFLKSVAALPHGSVAVKGVELEVAAAPPPQLPAQGRMKKLARQQAKVEMQVLKCYQGRFEAESGGYFCPADEILVRNRMAAGSGAQLQADSQKMAAVILVDTLQAEKLRQENAALVGQLFGNQTVLAHMLEMKRRDIDLYQHSMHVAALALLLGKALHYAGEELISLGHGAMLHDIGKLTLAAPLRNQTAAACQGEEKRAYSFHPRMGHELLARAEQIGEASKMIVLRHHENVDSSDPQGRQENKIREMIRIVAICDVYEHLMNARQSGVPLTLEDVIKQLFAAAKTPFDRSVVVKLAKHLPVLARVFKEVVSAGEGKTSLPLPASARLRKFALRGARVRSRQRYHFATEPALAEHVEEMGLQAADTALRHFVVNNELHALHLQRWAREQLATIFANRSVMAYMAEILQRDAELYRHSISVSILAMSLGQSLGYTAKRLENLGEGAMLHDVGMLLLPGSLRLRNYSDLTEAEKELYQVHSVLGYKQLRIREDISRATERIALRHHERLDGKGYPHGASGADLDELVRIVSICDTYDKLTRRTEHGAEMPPYQAVEYLVANGDAIFDKKILAEFLRFIMIFPTGTIVVLNDGRSAVVEKQNKNFPARPIVRLLFGEQQRSLDLLKEVHLVIKHFG